MSKLRILRLIPFVAGTALSLYVAARSAQGRKPFFLDLDVSAASLHASLGKTPHYASVAGIFVLAIVATGMERPGLAFCLTMLVGTAWELAEASAVGHTGRLADLVPDLISAVACLVLVSLVRVAMSRHRRQWRD
jgi:hypothetical protein